MSIVEQINRDITAAMKAKEAERLSALRMVKTALTLRQTELPGGVDDTEAVRVLNTLLKQRRDEIPNLRVTVRAGLVVVHLIDVSRRVPDPDVHVACGAPPVHQVLTARVCQGVREREVFITGVAVEEQDVDVRDRESRGRAGDRAGDAAAG